MAGRPEPLKGNGLAVAALVLGIVGSVFGLIPLTFFIAILLGLVGLGVGIPGLIAAHRRRREGKVLAWFGVALSLLAVVLGGVGAAIVDDAFDDASGELDAIEQRLDGQ